MTFSLITLSYHSKAQIERCLSALVAQDAEIIHADNGGDLDMAALAKKFPTVRQMANPVNFGFAVGMNRAVAESAGAWIGLINPDAFIDAGWLNAMKAAIARYPDVKLFTSLQLNAEQPDRLDGAGDALTFFGFPYRAGISHSVPPHMEIAEVFAPCGAAMLIRRDLWDELGGFDEDFFCYCEDADLGFRARLRGERCLFVPDAIVSHIGSASLGVRSDFALYHGYRNRLWLYLKNMPLALLIATFAIHIGLTLIGALKDTLRGKGALVFRALRDAFQGLRPIFEHRKLIQKTRQIGSLRLAKSLTWNLQKILTRQIVRRSIDHRKLP
ncbi:glycosyltransferase family 2 protein [Asticcacaulis sp.]|uniref:glycosyltransferase family 2 protein n=1 Tax=Asticcacaulis sp. TaxID=1872648 RepID=UPI002BFD14D0|nr:glycosyltransferase family 2 protein [Asticcacaulis sp.]HTM80151.1 glycosyltransferase family 2 protein [Asticcacaulis sp.]